MPKVKCREFFGLLQNLIKGEIPLIEIAQILIDKGVAKQNDVKKLANSLSNRIYNDGYFTDIEHKAIMDYYKSGGVTKKDSDSVILDYFPDVFGSCGNGVFESSQEKEPITVPMSALFKQLTKGKQYSVINVRGNSMEPLIFDKDKLIIEHWNGEQIVDNHPYIFCYKDEIFIKRLAKNVDQLMIMSENKDYDTRKLTGEQLKDVNIIGQVVGLMRDLR